MPSNYVEIAPGVEGYAYVDPATNELVTLETDDPNSIQGLRPATPEEVAGARRGRVAQGQKAMGLAETAIANASFGLLTDRSPEAQARAQVLEQENPISKDLAAVGGSLLPAVAGGGLASLGVRALGGGALAAGVGSFAGEELAQGAALAMAQAAETDGTVDVGSVFQGMAEGAAFLGAGKLLAKGFRAGRRAFRGAEKAGEAAAGAARVTPDAPDAGPDAALARGQAKAQAEAARTAEAPTRKTILEYAENKDQIHEDVNDLAYDAGNRIWGRDGSFDAAHSIGYKKQDIAGRMTDADMTGIEDTAEEFAQHLDELAAKLSDSSHTSAPSAAAARTIRAQATEVRAARARHQLSAAGLGSGGPEDAAIALDQAKRHLDNLRSKFGAASTKVTDPTSANVQMIDEVLEPMRASLEDAKIWGENWASKQREENKLWSGRDGIIESRAQWQAELVERMPGAAGTARTAGRDLPVSVMKDGFLDSILALPKNKQRRVLDAVTNDVEKSYKMAEIKLAMAGPDTRAAVQQVMNDLADMRAVIGETQRVVRINARGGPIIKKVLERRPIEDVALGALDRLPGGKAVKQAIGERLAQPAAAPMSAQARDLLDRIQKRRNSRGLVDLGASVKTPKKIAIAAENMGLTEFELEGFLADNRIPRGPRGTVVMADLHARPDFQEFINRKAIERYTENSAFMVNKNLRTKGWNKSWAYQGASAAEKRYYEGMKGIAKRAADVMRDTSDNTAPIFRGTAVDAKTLKAWQAAGEVRDPAFSSFSTDETIARRFIPSENFAGQFAESGTERVFIRAPGGGHRYGGPEQEVMFAPGAPLKIKRVTKEGDVTVIDVEPAATARPTPMQEQTIGQFRKANEQLGAVITNGAQTRGGVAEAIAKSPLGFGTAAAGALGARYLAGVNAETEAIRDIDASSKATAEQSAINLGAPELERDERPSVAERFLGEHPDLATAFQSRMADLDRLLADPAEFVARMTQAFGPLADAGHPEMASKVITRMMVGAQYLRENAPPTLGQSMFQPEGAAPDEIAVLQFAPVWEAVWRPMDTVRDFGERLATPSAIRAIREVHPDVYARLQSQVFQSLAPGGPAVNFETKQYLDSTMQMGGALGRSFAPGMTTLAANGRQNNQQVPRGISGGTNIAPETATAGFSKGPSAIR